MLISGLKGDTPTVRYLNEFGEEVEGYLCAMTEEVQTVPHQSTTVPDGTYLIIPIAFHVIYNEDGDGYVPTYMIDDQMVFLNDIFNPSGIHFELFSTDWTENDYWYNQVPPYGQEREPQEVEMKQSLNQDPAHILNVYTAYPTGALGWGTFPMDFNENDPLRGVVMHFECITGGAYEPYNQGDLLVHEIGHCLGLYHTFQNGCLSPGDEVDDTPYQNKGQEHICDENKDTCPNDPGNDPIHNFMNYTDNNCTTEFTQGQYERMYSIIEEHSPSLIENTQVINVDYSDITSNIGGFLNVTVNLDLEFNNVESGSILQLELNSLYTVITQDEWIENKKHYGWGFNSDFLMETQSFLNLLGIARVWNAQFDEQVQINLQSTGPIEFYDPWYYDNATQTQPDDFRPVSPGQYQVFLNQYPIVGPAYALQAPEKYITMEEIYIFNRWEGNNVDFGGSTTSTTDLITDVVFEASGATVTAYYDNALTGTGMTVEIPAGETVNFPAGGTYLWDNANTGF
ncbi:MAG: zinc metalloprotease, partial [Candidatus Marinimicrobia bacterium]|nr:zinc metalloprotease [Candidatus Neomarinimicrobiota bacterium]